ncbi:DNA repair protein Rad2p [Trichomonascus vanleenenianus]|uniref:ssDNA endodeoxyribonuclease RAD2 n=1 Tax=Trichomonascus vanleenenianus TaxID=2268995 RepID=UPI003ECA8B67
MGVHGLWQIVAPAAKPIPVESLQDSRLAVDASIWIYQFMKAVRDANGEPVPHAHIVGFYRRICKLLYLGVKPVFVFDGAAPALKQRTVARRRERREGRRESARHTAAKILTKQLHTKAMKPEKKKLADQEFVYYDERDTGKSEKPFRPMDQYHLPEVDDIHAFADQNDPRLMTEQELTEYAEEFQHQLSSGLYDTSEVDFDSEEFKQLPLATQYQLVNTARLRSRLRMGYSAEQLDQRFPDRLEFSRFQIERVVQRNYLTQKIMNIVGMDDDVAAGKRIVSDKDREYVLQKVEGGYTLAFHGGGEDTKKPIVLDELSNEEDLDEENQDEEEDLEWEDVPLQEAPIQETKISKEKDNDSMPVVLPESLMGFETQLQRQRLAEKASSSKHGATTETGRPGFTPFMNAFVTKPHATNEPETSEEATKITNDHNIEEDDLFGSSSLVGDKPLLERASEPAPPWFLQQRHALKQDETARQMSRELAMEMGIDVDDQEDQQEVEEVRVLDQGPAVHADDTTTMDETRQRDNNVGQGDTNNVPVDLVNRQAVDDQTVDDSKDLIVEKIVENQIEDDSKNQIVADQAVDYGKDQIVADQAVDDKDRTVEEQIRENDTAEEKEAITAANGGQAQLEQAELAEQEELYAAEEDENLVDQMIEEIEDAQQFVQQHSKPSVTTTKSTGGMGTPTSMVVSAPKITGVESAKDNRARQMMDSEIALLRRQHRNEVRDASEVSSTMIEDCQHLLQLFGIPYITAPMEAEAQCGELVMLGLADGIVTDDSDCFLFGGTRVFKNMFNQAKWVECYETVDFERMFNLSRTKLIELALLLGSDYTDGLPGIGPVTAMELLADFESLGEFRTWWLEVQASPARASQREASTFRDRFKKRHLTRLWLPEHFPPQVVIDAYQAPEVDPDPTAFVWGKPDLDGLRKFLHASTGWPKGTIDEMLLPVIREMNRPKTTQKSIHDYFTANNPAAAPQEISSGATGKRMLTAMEKLAAKKKRKKHA